MHEVKKTARATADTPRDRVWMTSKVGSNLVGSKSWAYKRLNRTIGKIRVAPPENLLVKLPCLNIDSAEVP